MGQAEEVAKVLVFLLSDDASFVTGGEYRFDRDPAPSKADMGSLARWTVDGGYSACGFYRAG
jgi:NAD(P)-dependent dehydrogenase (short-subunit alcohol dehydrogenase family)